jgi:hypothetical protein
MIWRLRDFTKKCAGRHGRGKTTMTASPHHDASPQFTWKAALAAGVRRHAVALISLAVALFGTSYNTWRNQTTEVHRNTRAAAFMVLDALGQLQEIADRRRYDGDRSDANRIGGWGKVSAVRDLAPLISHESETGAGALFDAWKDNVDKLDANDDAAEAAITDSIVHLREGILAELKALN